jgi:hypothetical protein
LSTIGFGASLLRGNVVFACGALSILSQVSETAGLLPSMQCVLPASVVSVYRISNTATAFLYPKLLTGLQEALLQLQAEPTKAAISFTDVLEHEGHIFVLYPHKKPKKANKFKVPVSDTQ